MDWVSNILFFKDRRDGVAGYIGNHKCVELLNNGYEIIVVDNLSNSSIESLNRGKK